MNYWIFKSEPDSFSLTHLKDMPKSTSMWDGVRNYQARNFMRDECQVGDMIFFHHSSCKVPGIVGLAKVTSEAYADPTQFDPKSPYFDPKSSKENPRWFLVDVTYVEGFDQILTLKELKENSKLEGLKLIAKGNRLSIMPVEAHHAKELLKLAGK